MKKTILLLLLLTGSTISFAQQTICSIGPELAIPGGRDYGFKRTAGIGVGGSFRVEYLFSKHISVMATMGYLTFGRQDKDFSGTPPTTTKVHTIPIQGGLKYYIKKVTDPLKGIFISVETGFMGTTTHFDYALQPDKTYKEGGFPVALGFGYQDKAWKQDSVCNSIFMHPGVIYTILIFG